MLRRVFHGSLGSVNWQSLGIGSPGFENAVLSRLMHSITTSFSRSAIASNGSLELARDFFLASVLDHSTALDNALAACCLKTSGSSSGVGGGGGLGTEEFVFGRGWSGDRFGGADLPSRTFRGLAFGAAWDADAAQLLLLPAGSTVRPRSVTALADGCSGCRCALPMV